MEPVRFPSGPFELEGVFTRGPEPKGAVLILHPHPQFGGSMDNEVVLALEESLSSRWATLRFNFRGVGARPATQPRFAGGTRESRAEMSGGSYDRGNGETEDARAALSFLSTRGFPRAVVAGYSFGAWIASRLADDPRVAALALVSPPIGMFDFSGVQKFQGPLLVVSGRRDAFVNPGRLQTWFDGLSDPKALRFFEGDHFWFGGAGEVAQAVTQWLADLEARTPRTQLRLTSERGSL